MEKKIPNEKILLQHTVAKTTQQTNKNEHIYQTSCYTSDFMCMHGAKEGMDVG